jgi:TolA-binding protein
MWASSALSALLLLSGVAWAGSGVSADYARQVDTAQLRLAQIEAGQVDLDATVRRLEEAQRSSVTSPSGGGEAADSGAVRALRGDIEVLQFELRSLKESVEALALDMDTRLLWQEQRSAQLEQALGLTPPPMPVAGAPIGPQPMPENTGTFPQTEPVGVGGVPAAPIDANGLMELAVGHMTEARQPAARAVLERMLREFPEDERAAEASYRIAETYFNEEKWIKAVSEFQLFQDRYPRHELASWAMLRQGEAFERRGARSDAVLFWEGVIQRYPRTEAAAEAQGFLE